MPNLRDDIVKRLEDFPATVVEGKTFREYLEDLAEDIQADVIKAMVNSPNQQVLKRAAFARHYATAGDWLNRVSSANNELEYKVDQLANSRFGATLHNLIFLSEHRPIGAAPALIVRAMLRAFVIATSK